MTIREFREKVNLSLYSSKGVVTIVQRIIMALVTLVTFGALIYYYGFPQTIESKTTLIDIFKFSFGVYIFNYILKYIYDFEPYNFFKRTWFEGLLMLILVVEGISYNLFGTLLLSSVFENIGIDITTYSNVLIQIYFLVVAFYEAGKATQVLPKIRLHPAVIFISSFLIIILAGAGLLMLPEMTNAINGLNFTDAIFMSTSATTTTGLATVDVADFLTFKGQLIMVILVKLGGLNVIVFGSFLALASKFGMGVKQHSVVEDFMNKDSLFSAKGILKKILIWSLLIETTGVLLLYFSWEPELFDSYTEKLFSSVFHSVAAFNNAGLSTFSKGYDTAVIEDNYMVHNITTALMFLGALGFVAIIEIFDYRKIKDRIKQPWKSLSFGTKIALYFSLGLVLVGWFFFYIFEASNTLENKGFFEAMSHSLLYSVSARSSGFNTLDNSMLTDPTILLLIFLMFIGGSSSSTAGGIKTSTFAIIWATVIAIIRNRHHAQLFKKTISNLLVQKALSILAIYLILLFFCTILLSITESAIITNSSFTIMDLIFEEASAFSTTGLSTGITPYISVPGKVILIVSMFIGRVGMLTVAYALGKEAVSKRYKYPKGHTMIG